MRVRSTPLAKVREDGYNQVKQQPKKDPCTSFYTVRMSSIYQTGFIVSLFLRGPDGARTHTGSILTADIQEGCFKDSQRPGTSLTSGERPHYDTLNVVDATRVK